MNRAYSGRISPLETLGVLAYFTFPLWMAGVALLTVDQDKEKHPNQVFKLPPAKQAPEIENSPESSRQFMTTALLAGKVACPPSFVRRGNIELTKPLPLVKTVVEFPLNHAIFTKEAVSSNTELDRLVTCSYPESDPKEIMNIPIVREGR